MEGILHSDPTERWLRAKDGGSPRCCPVLCGLRDRCIAAMLATRKGRDAKAELNHRNQACEVLADTGIRVAKRFPSAPNPAPGHYFGRARPRSARRIHLGNWKWTSIRVARPVFRFGRPACISQHLCSNARRAKARRAKVGIPCGICAHVCGFADRRLNCSANGMFFTVRQSAKARNPCRVHPGSHADCSRRGLNRSCSPH